MSHLDALHKPRAPSYLYNVVAFASIEVLSFASNLFYCNIIKIIICLNKLFLFYNTIFYIIIILYYIYILMINI